MIKAQWPQYVEQKVRQVKVLWTGKKNKQTSEQVNKSRSDECDIGFQVQFNAEFPRQVINVP